MTGKIPPRDWEALSAYLDDQLAPKERTRLETRLKANPEMGAALEELRRTRVVLRRQPRLRAPRNFTLTPEMAGLRAGPRRATGAFPALRLASLMAALFFVILVVGDLVTGASQSGPLLVARQQPMEVTVQVEAPLAIAPMGKGGSGGGPGGAAPTEVQPPPAEAPAENVPLATGVPAPMAESAITQALTVEMAAIPTQSADTNILVVTPVPAQPEAVLGAQPTSTPVIALEVTPTPVIVQQVSWLQRLPTIRALQIILASLAVITGLAAILLRRSAG